MRDSKTYQEAPDVIAEKILNQYYTNSQHDTVSGTSDAMGDEDERADKGPSWHNHDGKERWALIDASADKEKRFRS